MKEIQRYEQPTREALEVASRGRIIKSMGQDQTANLAVYGNYLALDAGAAGYSLATLSARAVWSALVMRWVVTATAMDSSSTRLL